MIGTAHQSEMMSPTQNKSQSKIEGINREIEDEGEVVYETALDTEATGNITNIKTESREARRRKKPRGKGNRADNLETLS